VLPLAVRCGRSRGLAAGGRRRARRRASPRSRPASWTGLPGCRWDVSRFRRPPGESVTAADRRRRRAVRGAVQARSRLVAPTRPTSPADDREITSRPRTWIPGIDLRSDTRARSICKGEVPPRGVPAGTGARRGGRGNEVAFRAAGKVDSSAAPTRWRSAARFEPLMRGTGAAGVAGRRTHPARRRPIRGCGSPTPRWRRSRDFGKDTIPLRVNLVMVLPSLYKIRCIKTRQEETDEAVLLSLGVSWNDALGAEHRLAQGTRIRSWCTAATPKEPTDPVA